MRSPRVKDLLEFSSSRPSVTSVDATIREVVRLLIADRSTREVYLVDAEGRFCGVITMRRLARFVFSQHVSPQSSATDLLELVSARHARDLAIGQAAHVEQNDSVETLFDVMFRFDIDEIPVVDSAGVVVGCLSLLDVMAAWNAGKLGDSTS